MDCFYECQFKVYREDSRNLFSKDNLYTSYNELDVVLKQYRKYLNATLSREAHF